MLETLLPIWAIGAIVIWWQRREARRLGIPWNDFIRMTPQERRKAGARIWRTSSPTLACPSGRSWRWWRSRCSWGRPGRPLPL